MAYSTIISKNCKGGCGRKPELGYQGYCHNCRPDLVAAKIKRQNSKQQLAYQQLGKKDKKAVKSRIKTSIRGLGASEGNVELVNRTMGKSELMKEADRVFSLFIRNSAKDKEGFVTCPLCHKRYHIEEKNWDKELVIQCLHFISRGVYSLRWSESNTIAGCCYCNKNMNDYSTGTAHAAYRKLLVDKIGETEVALMELEHRKINKIEAQQLRNVIEYYQNPL